jgi:hypothetical protein
LGISGEYRCYSEELMVSCIHHVIWDGKEGENPNAKEFLLMNF